MVGILEDPPSLPFDALDGLPLAQKASLPPRNQRVKRLERPNKAALEEQIANVQNEIDGLQARIFEIKTIVDNKTQNKHVASQELLDARKRLSELNDSFRAVVDERRAHKEELDLADKMRDRMRTDARSLREKLPYVRVEQLDEEIQKLEYRMTHTSLGLPEEKKLVSQIERLKKSREFVRDYNERMDRITQDEGSRTEFLDKIKEKDQLLNSLKVQQEEQRRILAQIRDKEASEALDIPALLQEKNTAIEKIKSLREEIKELRSDFWAREEEFFEREREWKAQQALERKLKAEKIQAERREREKIRKQRALENFVEPYTDEIILCDQLMSYMQKLAPPSDDLQAVSPLKAEIVAPKGVGDVIVSKKNRNDDLEGWFGGFGGKGKGKKTKASTPAKSKEKERLPLSLDALTSFQKVKLSPPTTFGDVLRSLDELKEKKESFLNLQKKAREAREKEENGEEAVGEAREKEENGVEAVAEAREEEENGAEAVAEAREEEENGAEAVGEAEGGAVLEVGTDEEVVSEELVPEAAENGTHAEVVQGEIEESVTQDADPEPEAVRSEDCKTEAATIEIAEAVIGDVLED